MDTRSGEKVSPQVAVFGDINLTKSNFHLDNGQFFLIKNEGTEPVSLDVVPAGAEDGTFVKTIFDVGWNPEIVKEVKVTSLSNLKLKYGY